MLLAFFAAQGRTEADARTMAARIADWRDVDDQPRPIGAERDEYQHSGRTYGPRDGPFESVAELRQILGAEHFDDALLNAFTVYSHLSEPVPAFMPPQVRQALLWADTHQLSERRWLLDAENPPPAQDSPTGQVLQIHACVDQSNDAICRLAIVRLTGKIAQPLQVFLWMITK